MDVRLAELMCSRLCHDLAGPLGAARNGLELLDELGAGPLGDESASVIKDSLAAAHDRLQFLRLAYGSAGQRAADGFVRVREAAAHWLRGSRVALDWPDDTPAATAAARKGLPKIILNLILLACDVLPHGGTIHVSGYGDEASGEVQVQAVGATIKWTPVMAAPFAEPAARLEDRSADTVQPVVCKVFSEYFGLDLTVDAEAGLSWRATLFW